MRAEGAVLETAMRFLFGMCLCYLALQSAYGAVSNLTLKVGSETYSNVTFGTVTSTRVKVFHSAGVTSLLLAKLSPELQQRFGYNPPNVETKVAAPVEVVTSHVVVAPAATPPLAGPVPAEPAAEDDKVAEVLTLEQRVAKLEKEVSALRSKLAGVEGMASHAERKVKQRPVPPGSSQRWNGP